MLSWEARTKQHTAEIGLEARKGIVETKDVLARAEREKVEKRV